MAISFGKVGSGSGSGGGSSNIGYVSAVQNGYTTLTNNVLVEVANFNTPAFKVTNKNLSKFSLFFKGYLRAKYGGGISGLRLGYYASIKFNIRKSSTKSGLSGDFSSINLSSGGPDEYKILYDELVRTNDTHGINGYTYWVPITYEIPFNAELLSDVNDNDWVEFRPSIQVGYYKSTNYNNAGVSPSNLRLYGSVISLSSYGIGPDSTDIGASNISDNAITSAKLADGSVTEPKIAVNAVTTNKINDGSITSTKISSDAIITSKISDNSITAPKLANNAIIGEKVNDGAITSSKLATNSITTAKIVDGSVTSSKIYNDSITSNKLTNNSVTPTQVSGITPGANIAGHAVSLDSSGTAFIAKPFPTSSGGGSNQTLGDITGLLSTSKGGTGIDADNITDLKNRLGIGGENDILAYCSNAKHQSINTVQRTDSSTSGLPTGKAADGLITRTGNDQFWIELANGHKWTRTHTDTRGSWTNPSNGTLTNVDDLTKLAAMTDGSIEYTDADICLPSYNDNSKPPKVIIGRSGNYLIAINRNNMWWASRPAGNDWSSINWTWEGDANIPDGLRFTGGEHDEEKIPLNGVGVLAGKTGIDGENYIAVMVLHKEHSGNSRYTGYYLDDDGSQIKVSTNSRTYGTSGDWVELKAGIDDIADTIITADRDTGEPVFHGIIPEISSMGFPGYRFKIGTSGLAKGDISYVESTRTAYVWHKNEDKHLGDLFHEDFEVEIHKDDSNYIKGVFEQVAANINLPGQVVITGALFRGEDLKSEGTINSGDTVEIKGHKSVITKDDTILPVNLGLAHGASEAGKVVKMDSTGDNFELSQISGIPSAANIPSTSPTKSRSLTVTSNSNPGDNEINISDSGGCKVKLTEGEEATKLRNMISDAISKQQWLLIVKNQNNYIAIKPTASTITSGAISSIGENIISRVQRGSLSANDNIKIWVRPDNASKHIVHDFLGESIIIEPERPHLIYNRQSSSISGNDLAAGTGWNWIVTTPPWKIPNGFRIGGHIEVKGGGVANFGSGSARQIVPEMIVRHKSGNTLTSTNNADWRNLGINPNLRDGSTDLLFRSKVSSGSTSNEDRWRDYWAYASKPMPMRDFHSDCADGNFIQFQLGIRKGNSANPDFTQIYGFDMTVHVWPPSLVTAS